MPGPFAVTKRGEASVEIRKAGAGDTAQVTRPALLLWPAHICEDLFPEMREAVPEPGAGLPGLCQRL